ncbi:hypothetical protein KJ762_15955 [bacterium]|nr:hypothetical protein [bacterium]MBU1635979.1 hypothetical protein [bacterium]MBU1873678.1 hypothetical protein [bacterium]
MKKILFLMIMPIIVVLFFNCSKENDVVSGLINDITLTENGVIVLSDEDKIILEKDNLSDTENEILSKTTSTTRLSAHDTRLKYFAQALAASLENEEMIDVIKNEAMKKFDGDTEVLWDMVSGKLLANGTTFRQYIDSKYVKYSQSLLSIDEIEKVPLLNILFVTCCDDCFGDKPIKVTFVPLSKNDIEVDSVIAYDSKLNEYTISNTECPDFPLIAVGVNERVDPISKAVKYNGLSKQAKVSGYNEGYCLSFNEAWLYDDNEPCTKGAAEIYFRVYAYDASGNEMEDDTPEYEHMNYDIFGICATAGANLGHWTSNSSDPDYAAWLPSYFFDTNDHTTKPTTCKIVVWEDDTIDDDRVERYWSLIEGGEGSIIIPWPSHSSYLWYYGGGDSRDCDLKIIACVYSSY